MVTMQLDQSTRLEDVLSRIIVETEDGEVSVQLSDTPARTSLEPTEGQLVRDASQGDDAALAELCRREWIEVYKLAEMATDDAEEAEELTEEIFVRAISDLPSLHRSGGSFAVRLRRIADHVLAESGHRAPSRPTCRRSPSSAGEGRVPEAVVLAAELRDTVCRTIATLPGRYQEVLQLRLIEGRASADIAPYLGMSPAGVRQLQHRAVQALRVRFETPMEWSSTA